PGEACRPSRGDHRHARAREDHGVSARERQRRAVARKLSIERKGRKGREARCSLRSERALRSYSARSASIGSTRAARRAGTYDASATTAHITAITAAYVNGSIVP